MFGHAENKKLITDMTYSPIQGFPRSKKDQTIHEIVREIRLADKKREAITDRRKA
jgi:preprotein translocase subunit Sec63